MSIAFPNRKSLINHVLGVLRRFKVKPDFSSVSFALSEHFNEKYDGKSNLSEAIDRILGWSDPAEEGGGPKWKRFVQDVLREHKNQSRTSSYLNIGDLILYGKYKNKKGRIVEFGEDAKGNPTVTIEPIPKGRKKNKTMGLFKIWKNQSVKEAAERVVTRYLNARN